MATNVCCLMLSLKTHMNVHEMISGVRSASWAKPSHREGTWAIRSNTGFGVCPLWLQLFCFEFHEVNVERDAGWSKVVPSNESKNYVNLWVNGTHVTRVYNYVCIQVYLIIPRYIFEYLDAVFTCPYQPLSQSHDEFKMQLQPMEIQHAFGLAQSLWSRIWFSCVLNCFKMIWGFYSFTYALR